jgi:hypothetical protein
MQQTASLRDPRPLGPLHEHVVDGARFTLRWEPAEGAERYRVQIARESGFADVVFEQDLPANVTALAMHRYSPEDERTYYWRVVAGYEGGWSAGARVESFINGSAEEADRFVDPDTAEPFGPVAALFRHATLEAAAEAIPGRQPRIEASLGEEHPEGVEAAQLLNVEVGLLAAMAIVIAVVLFIAFAMC